MTEERTKFCPRCGAMIPYEEVSCPLCGEPQPQFSHAARRSGRRMWVAVALSLLVTGLGHVYLGEWRRGLVFFGVVFALGFAASGYIGYDRLIILGAVIGVAAAYDVYRLSRKGG